MLDEPSAGVQPDFVDAIFSKIHELSQRGFAVEIFEQKARKSLTFSNYAYGLEMGRNRFEGTGQALLHDPAVINLYLGASRSAAAQEEPNNAHPTQWQPAGSGQGRGRMVSHKPVVDSDGEIDDLSKIDKNKMKPFAALPLSLQTKLKGRPKAAVTKERISIRLSPDVVQTFRATGEGWQTGIDSALNE